MGRYVARVMDKIFTKEEIIAITLEELLKDERYEVIKGQIKAIFFIVIVPWMLLYLEAVRCRFKLNHKMMDIEWPTLHECVLQKRRNEMKKGNADNLNNWSSTTGNRTRTFNEKNVLAPS